MTLPITADMSAVRFEITVKGKAALANWDAPPWTDAQIRRLFEIHAPRLRTMARRMGVAGGDCDHVATTVMDDVVLKLLSGHNMPSDLAGYLNVALRNRVRSMHRDHDRRRLEYLDDDVPTPEAGDDSPLLPAALVRLLAFCMAVPLRPEEAALLPEHGHRPMPATERVRLFRARRRIRQAVSQYLRTLTTEERSEVERFLRRAR